MLMTEGFEKLGLRIVTRVEDFLIIGIKDEFADDSLQLFGLDNG